MTTEINTHGLLTRREEQVFLLVAQGKSIKDAARCLRISRGTTYEYIEHGKTKLGAETTPHAISLLWERRLIRHATRLCLLLALWLPLRQAWLDSDNDNALRITRSQRTTRNQSGARGQSRARRSRTGREQNSSAIELDPDTGELIWPEPPQRAA